VSEHSDPDLARMARLIDGDDSALNQLMDRWQKPLLSFILRYVGNHADSIELAQETFVRVYQNRSRFNFKSKFSTWLLAIATNLCRHHARWRTRHPTISLDETASADEAYDRYLSISAEETPSGLAERSELAKLVRMRLIGFLTISKQLSYYLSTKTFLMMRSAGSWDVRQRR
jgi:RNA polymerase sigma-70 factor (ECF subfamily)